MGVGLLPTLTTLPLFTISLGWPSLAIWFSYICWHFCSIFPTVYIGLQGWVYTKDTRYKNSLLAHSLQVKAIQNHTPFNTATNYTYTKRLEPHKFSSLPFFPCYMAFCIKLISPFSLILTVTLKQCTYC